MENKCPGATKMLKQEVLKHSFAAVGATPSGAEHKPEKYSEKIRLCSDQILLGCPRKLVNG